jgi:hypothetical protein
MALVLVTEVQVLWVPIDRLVELGYNVKFTITSRNPSFKRKARYIPKTDFILGTKIKVQMH